MTKGTYTIFEKEKRFSSALEMAQRGVFFIRIFTPTGKVGAYANVGFGANASFKKIGLSFVTKSIAP
jgi:hypothetical protein